MAHDDLWGLALGLMGPLVRFSGAVAATVERNPQGRERFKCENVSQSRRLAIEATIRL